MKSNSTEKPILEVLNGKSLYPPPIWMMRQAGRYLPEYREVRSKVRDFLSLCYDVDLAVEVSLQPVRIFGFDAAILFSDIFVITDAMGYEVEFVENTGPILKPLNQEIIDSLNLDLIKTKLDPVFKIISRLRTELQEEKTLIGFCGAPWTIACYTIAGKSSPGQTEAKIESFKNPELVENLIEKLIIGSIEYLDCQISAGVETVQIFDTWAGVLDEIALDKWVVNPMRRIVEGVRKRHPKVKIIGFPKGLSGMLDHYVQETKVDAIGLDWTVPFDTARKLQKNGTVVQGNLDPMRLVAGGTALDEAIDHILEQLGDGPLIFNLGHGITPNTPVSNVKQMVQKIRSAKN